jgi:hypothetical protein
MVIRRRNRQTGTYITIGRSADLGLDPNGGWLTICEKHDFIISHDTKGMAVWHSPDPLGWCEGCMEEVREKEAWEEAKRHQWN